MRVAIVAGSYEVTGCGVTHNSIRLVAALREAGVSAELVAASSWSIWRIGETLRLLRTLAPDVVHIQYPTIPYGYSLVPQCLSVAIPAVVTIHEVSHARIPRRLALYPFGLRSRQIVFTAPHEMEYARRWAPWIASRSRVISIGCSIPVLPRSVEEPCGRSIVHFGFLRPRKGLEQVLELARLLKESDAVERVTIVGATQPRWADYLKALRRRASGLPIDWQIGLPDIAIAELLAGSEIAYLPFPDGASHRRSSLIAALCHGVATITTRGVQTPSDLSGVVELVDSPQQALEVVQRLRWDHRTRRGLSSAALEYARRFSWTALAREHIELYESLLDGKNDC